ncbi:cyclic nucleotide-binding domain-containing protein [Pseudosporangium ferrugineum]|uniref:cyclic nucleotide-binding domain-containing protein n=1 Tax=Pseudosporangium ferrugineum TaxID=439699 RepID=UPI001FE264CC|nr:cyclic nucleotide-binding domain-containing protein [Pseudosporangium ferrugineum]
MTTFSVFDLLVLHPFLSGMPGPRLRQVAVHGRPVVWPAGYRVFREDAVAANFWLVTSGEVDLDFHVPGRGDVVIDSVAGGGLLGLSWLRAPYRWTTGAVCTDRCQAVEFDARGVRNLMAEDSGCGADLTRRVTAVLGDRLRGARARLTLLGAVPPDPAGTLSRAPRDE